MEKCKLYGEHVWGQTLNGLSQKVDYLFQQQKLQEHITGKLRLYLDSPDSMNLNEHDRAFLEALLINY